MASYFRQVPNLEYVSRASDARLGDYSLVKNLFKRAKIRDDIFKNVTFFEKYQIVGDDRPDNVAFKVYDDPTLDWIVLLSNNIINVQSEWPMTQDLFDRYLLQKYGDYNTIYNGIHHYETVEIKNSTGVVIVKQGLEVKSPFAVSYYDFNIEQQIDHQNIATPVTNYEYEERLENNKRNIFVLKSDYLSLVVNDIENIMPYKNGSSQYVSEDLKRTDNIRLYE